MFASNSMGRAQRRDILFPVWIVMLLLSPAGLWAEEHLAPRARADRVLVEKREHTLTLLEHGKVLKKYRVALGGDPLGCQSRVKAITRRPKACTNWIGGTRTASSIVRFTFLTRMPRTGRAHERPELRLEAT